MIGHIIAVSNFRMVSEIGGGLYRLLEEEEEEDEHSLPDHGMGGVALTQKKQKTSIPY